MLNGIQLVFSKDKIDELINYLPDKIVATAIIEERLLDDNTKAGVVKVQAHAMRNGQQTPLATIDGCPVPPCDAS